MNCHGCKSTGLAVVVACSADASLHLVVQQATGSKLVMFESSVAGAHSFHKADQQCIEQGRDFIVSAHFSFSPPKKGFFVIALQS